MQSSAEQLVVRQHERIHCRIASLLRVSTENAEQVSLARAVGDGNGGVDAFITDCSRGGLGIESPVFLPRGCRLRIRARVASSAATGTTPASSDGSGEMIVRVQRVTMLDRKPIYYLGVSFVSKGLEHDAAVVALLDAARKAPAAVGPKAAATAPTAAPAGKEGQG